MANFSGYKGNRGDYNTALANARYKGCSPAFSYLAIAGSSSPAARVLEIMRGMLNGAHPYLTPAGYIALTHFISQSAFIRETFVDISPLALNAGLLSARWLVPADVEVEDAAVLADLSEISRKCIPTANNQDAILRTALTYFREKVLSVAPEAAADVITDHTTAYVREVVGGVNGYAGKLLTTLECGGVPWDKIFNVRHVEANLGTRAAIIAYFTNNPIANWNANLTPTEFLHLCNFIGRYASEPLTITVMKCVFISTSGLCKGDNVTPTWVSRRYATLKTEYPALGGGGFDVTHDDVKAFVRTFIPRRTTVGTIYSGILYNRLISNMVGTPVISWMGEQARGSNITGLNAIAIAATSFDAFTWTIMSKYIPDHQMRSAVTAMVHTIQQPYATLHEPVIPIINYADLAYVALRVSLTRGLDDMVNAVGGKCKVPNLTRVAIIEMLNRYQMRANNAAVSVATIIDIYGINAAEHPNDRDMIVAYPNFGEAEVVPRDQDQGPVRRERLNDKLPRDLDNMLNVLRSFTIKEIITQAAIPADRAFLGVCTAFNNAVAQTVFGAIDEAYNDQHELAPRPLTEALTENLRILNVNPPAVNPIVLEPVPAINEAVLTPMTFREAERAEGNQG